MDKLDDALSNATVIVKEAIDPEPIEDQKPLPDEFVLAFFNLRNTDISKDDIVHIKEIADYVDSVTKGNERLDKLQVLRELRFKLGDPPLGMSKLNQVHQYVKLKQAAQKYADEALAMEA